MDVSFLVQMVVTQWAQTDFWAGEIPVVYRRILLSSLFHRFNIAD